MFAQRQVIICIDRKEQSLEKQLSSWLAAHALKIVYSGDLLEIELGQEPIDLLVCHESFSISPPEAQAITAQLGVNHIIFLCSDPHQASPGHALMALPMLRWLPMDEALVKKYVDKMIRQNELGLFQTLFEAIRDIVIVTTEAGQIVELNQQALNDFGKRREDLLGMNISDVIDGIPDRTGTESLQIHISDMDGQELRLSHKDGSPFIAQVKLNRIQYRGTDYHIGVFRDVTELKSMQEQTNQTLEMLHDSQKVAQIGTFNYKVDTDAWYTTATLNSMLQLESNSGRQLADWKAMIDPEFASDFQAWIDAILSQGSMSSEFKYRMRRCQDRALIWVKHTAYLSEDLRELRSTVQDITVPKLQSESMRRSQRRLKLSQHLVGLGTYLVQPDDNSMTFNSIYAELCGLDEAFPYSALDWSLPIHPDDKQAALDQHEHQLQTHSPLSKLEYRIVRGPQSEVRWLSSVQEYVFDNKGNLQRMLGAVQDVTEQKQTLLDLERSRDELRKLSVAVQQSPASVIITDLSGKIEYVNSKLLETTGYSQSEVLGRSPNMFNSGERSKAEYKRLWDTVLSGGVWQGEFHNRKKNGELFWEWAVISPVKDDQGQISHLLGVKEDITVRKSNEVKQKNLEKHLERSQRMEAIGILAGGIAHDFNNILQSMYLYLGMALDALPEGDIKEDIKQVSKGATRARDLVNQILTFSRRGATQKSDVLLQFVVKEAIKFLKSSLPITVKLHEDIDTELPPVHCDPTQLHQVFMNICTNAYDALPDRRGNIFISLSRAELEPDNFSELRLEPGEYIELLISDDGSGIPKSNLGLIFNPFFSTKEPGRGSGLGLSVAYAIVDELGGNILVESTEGEGSRFRILLPAVTAEPHPDEREVSQEIQFEDLAVFLLENDPHIRSGTKTILEKVGCQVRECLDTQDLLEQLESWDGDALRRLVIANYNLPEMTGIQLSQRVRELSSEIGFLLMTGENPDELDLSESDPTVDVILKKPWHTLDMVDAISQLRQKASKEEISER